MVQTGILLTAIFTIQKCLSSVFKATALSCSRKKRVNISYVYIYKSMYKKISLHRHSRKCSICAVLRLIGVFAVLCCGCFFLFVCFLTVKHTKHPLHHADSFPQC